MISLFVRSYVKDFKWLRYSVLSMRANLSGVDERVLCVPVGTHVPPEIASYFDKIVYSHERHVGYVAQQVDKVQAYRHCKHPNIFFSDSDCVYYEPLDARTLMQDGKIVLYQTRYELLKQTTTPEHKRVLDWQRITHKATGLYPEWEYMRRIPLLHKAAVCEYLDNNPTFQDYLNRVKWHDLSEFNAMGIIADRHFRDDYIFIDTEHEFPKRIASQYWSHGGITSQIYEELWSVMKPQHRSELGAYLNHLNLTHLGAEVGVLHGNNARDLLQSWRGYGLFLIDPYNAEQCGEYVDRAAGVDFDRSLMGCRKLLRKYEFRTIHIRDTSDNAYEILKGLQLDFVYIDGNHHNPQVTRDLENYWNLVKPGGLLCGHDYYDLDTPEYRCEVKSSVDAFLKDKKYDDFFTTESCSSWYVLKSR